MNQLEQEFYAKAGFKPDQPRVPAGQIGGGQWTGGGVGGGVSSKPSFGNVGSGTNNLPAQSPGWGDPKTLSKHVLDHGKDFGVSTREAYLNKAKEFYQRFRTEKLPAVQNKNGVIRIYDPKTNTFGAYNSNGSVRTFYKPVKGETYFENQIRNDLAKGGKIINSVPRAHTPPQKPSTTRPGGGRLGIIDDLFHPDSIIPDGGQVND